MLSETARKSLRKLFGSDRVITHPVELATYESDASFERGRPDGIVLPQTPEQVVALVRWMNEHEIPLVARGAGTGLSGGAVADRGGVIAAFSRMNCVLELDPLGRRAVVEPGFPNLQLDEIAGQKGLYYPPDPSSQRACTMGGNVAENAGGPHCFKYGVTTHYVTGLQVVLADGRIVRVGGQALDYPEYDLGGLIIGSEGTLALITAIAVRLIRRPPGIKTMMAIFDSIEQCGAAVSQVIAAGLVPATMELMDRNFVRAVEEYAHAGLPTDAGAVLIVEVDGYPAGLDSQMREVARILSDHGGRGLRLARDAHERDQIWLARKSAAGAFSRLAPRWYLVDITVPRSRLAETLRQANEICERRRLRVQYVLHAGDGNLHPVLLIPHPDDPQLIQAIHSAAREMVELGIRENGSLTGEHGVGIEKREYMPLMFSPAELSAMWDIKQIFDPRQLFNPGKIFLAQDVEPLDTLRAPIHAPSQLARSADALPARGEPAPANLVRPPPRFSQEDALAESPDIVLAPASTEQAAQMVMALVHARRRVRIGTQLSTTALTGIKKHAPEDLYVIVGAGMRLADLQAFLARDRLHVPLASPWSSATVGGIAAANINAPLRMQYGSVRDLVLAMTVVLGDGRVIRAGRPVVKNVAGYDLPKVFVGSHGTLGLITDVTLKLVPLPRARATLSLQVEDLSRALAYAAQMLPVALVASAIVLTQTRKGVYLVYTAEGISEDVASELEQVRRRLQDAGAPSAIEMEAPTGTDLWGRLLNCERPDTLVVRAGMAPQSVSAYIQENAAELDECLADLANGLVYAVKTFEGVETARTWLAARRQSAAARGGYVIILHAPEAWHLDPWGYHPDTLDLMRALKTRWDPWGIFESDLFPIPCPAGGNGPG